MQDDEAPSDEGRALPIDGVLDLHAFRPSEVGDLVPTWIEACREAGLTELRIVHGKGRGVLRTTVHALLGRHPHVRTYRLAPPDRGGWGATLVTLCDESHHLRAHSPAGEGRSTMLQFGKTARHYTADTTLRLAAPPDVLFAFFADPRSLELLSPPSLRLEVLPPVAATLRAGAIVDYRIRIYGVAVTGSTRIEEWAPPTRFVDVQQLRGPYLAWRHEHRFEPDGDGTRVVEHVEYRVPGGALVNALLVRPELQRIFDYRARELTARFGAR